MNVKTLGDHTWKLNTMSHQH